MVGRPRAVRGTQQFQTIRVFEHGCRHARGERFNRLIVGVRALDDPVVDISDVAHKIHFIADGRQPAVNHVKHGKSACVTDMEKVIDGRTACVQANNARLDGGERLLLSAERVVNDLHIFFCVEGRMQRRLDKRKLGRVSAVLTAQMFWK